MDSNRAVLISDVHMDQWVDDLGADKAKRKRKRFLEFLGWVGSEQGANAKRLVIVGDLVDVPTRNGKPLLPQYLDVAKALGKLVDKGIALTYVVGNHDSGIVGLSVAMPKPAIRVDYPYVRLKSGESVFQLEHGHLYDPWLWEYVRYHGATMLRKDPVLPGALALTRTGAGGRAADSVHPEGVRKGLMDAWQAPRDTASDDPDRVRALAAAVEAILVEADSDMAAEAQKVRAALTKVKAALPTTTGVGPSPLALALPSWDALKPHIERLIQFVYARPHWRSVARKRVAELNAKAGTRVQGIVMGHTHLADEMTWDEGGTDCQYVNSGSWRRAAADIVFVENGRLILRERKWTDDWPAPPQ